LRDALFREYGIGAVRLPLPVLRDLSSILFSGVLDLDCILVRGADAWRVAAVERQGRLSAPLGCAVDLGSTTIVLYLLDLDSGEELASAGYENLQRIHGEDILSRILFASGDGGLETLQAEVRKVLNRGILELSRRAGVDPYNVYFCSIAGNTTMIHFLLGLDPSHIPKEPYIPVANHIDLMAPQCIGLKIHPNGLIYCFPNVGSYFGGDLLAGILASGMHRQDEIAMLIDVGTNAEVLLGNSSWMVACAGAAGPALEGGILTCGMRAECGAIERISIDPKTLRVSYKTIDNEKPRGLCGSGVIDLLASLFLAGLVDPTGKLLVDRDKRHMRNIDGEAAFVVAFEEESESGLPIYITQGDIKNLIRSKGAMYTILNVVTESVGVGLDDIERFYIAGAFGNYINPENAVNIGMLPDVPLDRFVGLGNAAGKGAKELLLRWEAMDEVNDITKKITYLEMNVRADFMNKLTGALFLPHTDRSRFPNVWKRLENLSENGS